MSPFPFLLAGGAPACSWANSLAALSEPLAIAPGGYISLGKLAPIVLLVLGWAWLLTWADKDAVVALLPREWINLGMLCGMILAVALVFFLPSYAIALPLFIVILLIEVGVYLGIRHANVGLGDLREDFQNWRQGKKKDEKFTAPAGSVVLLGKTQMPLPVPRPEDATRMGYDGLQQLLTDPLTKNADRVDLVPVAEGAYEMRYQVDGMAYSAPAFERNMAAETVIYLKRAAGLSLEERRKPQKGSAKITFDGKQRELSVSTAGSTAGEFLKLLIDPGKRQSEKLDELGLLPEQLKSVRSSIQDNKGLVLVAAPRGHGLTTALYALLRSHDAFVEHIHTIERAPDQRLDGVTQNELPANAAPAVEFQKIEWVLSQLPDVIMINQVEEPRSAVALAKYAGEGKLVYVAIRAGNTFDALAQWRRLVGDDRLALKNVQFVMAGRVLRRLCAACKIGFTPDPEALRKLNINPAKAARMFAARKEPLRDSKGNPIPCDFCHNLHYSGRIGAYELLMMDEELRAQIQGGASVNQLKAILRKQRAKFLQEAAFVKVEEEETSIEEVVRALKAGETTAAAAAPAAARGSAR